MEVGLSSRCDGESRAWPCARTCEKMERETERDRSQKKMKSAKRRKKMKKERKKGPIDAGAERVNKREKMSKIMTMVTMVMARQCLP